MIRFRTLARLLALMLLLLAAGDLLIEGACDDGVKLTAASRSVFSLGDDGGLNGHAGEDCYCCSRTARAEAPQDIAPIVEAVGQREDVVRRFPQPPLPIPYHPPLA